jgi:hypothetical protein
MLGQDEYVETTLIITDLSHSLCNSSRSKRNALELYERAKKEKCKLDKEAFDTTTLLIADGFCKTDAVWIGRMSYIESSILDKIDEIKNQCEYIERASAVISDIRNELSIYSTRKRQHFQSFQEMLSQCMNVNETGLFKIIRDYLY